MVFFHSTIAPFRCYSICRSSRWIPYSTYIKNLLNNDNGKTKKSKIESLSPKRTRIKWTDEQKVILDAVSDGQSVFITGSAGTGKTLLMNNVVKRLKKIHPKGTVFVTASTGTAACGLNGQTVHSFAGVGIGLGNDESREMLLERVMANARACYRWSRVESLVIDEISMISHELFECLEYIARKVKSGGSLSEEKIWGGIQLVVSGDFFQLPPIMNKGENDGKVFAFEANCWNQSFDLHIELTKIFRQADPQLIKVLQEIRKGAVDSESMEILEKRSFQSVPDPSVVQLFPHTEDVKRVNKIKMDSLESNIIAYNASDTGKGHWKRLLDKGIALERLELCVGARVMLIKNLNIFGKLVNGATGTITRFNFYLDPMDKNDMDIRSICEYGNYLPVVKFDSGTEMVITPETWQVMDGDKVVAQRKQIRLMLAWAMSIHKCQGMTLDSLHTDLKRAFGPAMVYVALSRVKSFSGLYLSGFDPAKIKAHPKVVQFYKTHFLKV
ncbi:hypothetical protein LIER_09529 [Lithospermum erythrorhizon]|uniref:ATP-dependent DNA helicase n=1 Tax=Lithospermum erythrorhizon TaxID=34254 RepID=A0AAV3PH62_LITER